MQFWPWATAAQSNLTTLDKKTLLNLNGAPTKYNENLNFPARSEVAMLGLFFGRLLFTSIHLYVVEVVEHGTCLRVVHVVPTKHLKDTLWSSEAVVY